MTIDQDSGGLDTVLSRLDTVSITDMEVLSLPAPDPAERRALLERVAAAARDARPSRAVAVDDARRVVRDEMLRRLSSAGFQASFAGVTWAASPARAADRARLVVAVEDAAVADVLDDLLGDDDLAALRARFDIVASMAGTGRSGVPNLGPNGASAAAAIAAATVVGAGTGGAGLIAGLVALLRRRRRDSDDAD